LRLIINDIEIELPANFEVARTKQVNDIGELSKRQSNYTFNLKLPKTKKNQLAFDNLGAYTDTSRIPYQRNDTFLYNDTGQCEIYNGWSVIKETTNTYNITIYDGAIDFYKAIENKVLTDIGISELNHTKNTATVVASWDITSPYRYIVSDYNGKIFFNDGTNDVLNIDYLVPSVNVKWLWDKVHTFFGFTYTGNIFNVEEFTNLWMTFPKGLSNADLVPELIYDNSSFSDTGAYSEFTRYVKHLTPAPTEGEFLFGEIAFQVEESATYIFEQTGNVILDTREGSAIVETEIGLINLAKNVENFTTDPPTALFDTNSVMTLEAGETVFWYIRSTGNDIVTVDYSIDFNIKVKKLEGEEIDFEDALINFKVKDFINEVLWRFCLTPFKDKYTNNIDYITFAEWIQNTNYYDWSDRFNVVNGEKYIYSNYAQVNNLTYKYNDKEGDFNDGVLTINNVNLKSNTDIIRSRIYSPDSAKSQIFDEIYNIYPLWSKESREDANGDIEVRYKSKDKRFYFLRSEETEVSSFIGSESLSEVQNLTAFPRESYYRLSFNDIVQDYYIQIYGILNDTRVIQANVLLDDDLITNIDFQRLVYIKQLGNYYIINKIPNYVSRGLYNVELIRVKYDSIVTPRPRFAVITSYDTATNEISFVLNDYTEPNLIIQVSVDGGVIWYSVEYPSTSPQIFALISGIGETLLRLKHISEDRYSNIYIV